MLPLSRLLCCVAVCLWTSSVRADVESGPAAGAPVPKLISYVMIGNGNGPIDLTEQRGSKPTLYCFVAADKFSRQVYRLLRALDERVTEAAAEAELVMVWVTADVAETKDFLKRAEPSLKGKASTYSVFEGDANGPGEWGINTDAELTVVIVREAQVKKSLGYASANETLADEILASLK